MKFGLFYEHQLPQPWYEDSERRLIQDAIAQVELADPTWHRLRLGGRASFPGGIFALLGAGGVSGGMLAAHQPHPSWPWHHLDGATL